MHATIDNCNQALSSGPSLPCLDLHEIVCLEFEGPPEHETSRGYPYSIYCFCGVVLLPRTCVNNKIVGSRCMMLLRLAGASVSRRLYNSWQSCEAMPRCYDRKIDRAHLGHLSFFCVVMLVQSQDLCRRIIACQEIWQGEARAAHIYHKRKEQSLDMY
jgi:hypothetical protein